MTVVLF